MAKGNRTFNKLYGLIRKDQLISQSPKDRCMILLSAPSKLQPDELAELRRIQLMKGSTRYSRYKEYINNLYNKYYNNQ